MSEETASISVRILEKEYQFTCSANERDDLLRSAELLNRQMRQIREGGKVIGLDRIAIMAALNMAHELLAERSSDDRIDGKLAGRLRDMRETLEASLAENNRQLEL